MLSTLLTKAYLAHHHATILNQCNTVYLNYRLAAFAARQFVNIILFYVFQIEIILLNALSSEIKVNKGFPRHEDAINKRESIMGESAVVLKKH